MRRLISALAVLTAAFAAVLVSATPAHAYEVNITITGAGQITETTPANLVGSGCVTSANNPTGVVGATCLPGDPSGDYGFGWTVRLVATPKPGYHFVHWTTNGSPKPVLCEGANGSPTWTGTTCQFQTFDNLQTRAVFVDDTAPAMSSLSGPNQPVPGAATFTFSAQADPTLTGFQCRVAGVHDWLSCSSGRQENPPSGTYTFEVRAVDASGNLSAPLTKTWTVDKTPPDTSLSGGPSGTVATKNATFNFNSNEPGTFVCTLDGVSSTCTSPRSYSNLAEGQHTFSVAAVDAVGNLDLSPASRTWTVDTVAPDTTINGGPTGTVNSATAQFTFTSTEPGSTFTCSLDGASAPCTTPKSYSGLSDGQHTFTVAATDSVGNADASPASRTWTVDTTVPDTTPPDTSITGGPSGTANSAAAQFEFTSTEAGTFTCSLDGTSTPCTSPKSYTGLTDGQHTFTVAATDTAGNTDPSPATRTWTVDTTTPDTTPPDTTITGGPSGTVDSSTAQFEFTSTEPGTFSCSLDGVPAACTSPRTYNGLTDGQHTFTVTATDTAGNPDPSPASRTWTVDTGAGEDTTPPETTITSGPSGTSNKTGGQFTFASEPGAEFVCSLDGSAPSACSSPHFYAELDDGAHIFTVAARDASDNLDASPAVRTWTVDTVAPRVISKKPTGKKVSRNASPKVLFSEAMSESSVEASKSGKGLRFYLLQGKQKLAATVTYRRTPQGDYVAILNPKAKLRGNRAYKVVVKGAVDLAGNTVRPASWTFRTKR